MWLWFTSSNHFLLNLSSLQKETVTNPLEDWGSLNDPVDLGPPLCPHPESIPTMFVKLLWVCPGFPHRPCGISLPSPPVGFSSTLTSVQQSWVCLNKQCPSAWHSPWTWTSSWWLFNCIKRQGREHLFIQQRFLFSLFHQRPQQTHGGVQMLLKMNNTRLVCTEMADEWLSLSSWFILLRMCGVQMFFVCARVCVCATVGSTSLFSPGSLLLVLVLYPSSSNQWPLGLISCYRRSQ